MLDPRLHRLDPELAPEPLGDGPRDEVGVELAEDGDERALLLVGLAHDPRAVRPAVEDVLGEQLEERPLLLDHQDLLEPPRELAHDARLHREEQPHLEHADAVVPERGVVQPQLGERLSHVVVGLARGEDAEPRLRGGHGDAIQRVLPGVAPRQLEAGAVDCPLHVEAVGRDQVDVDLVLERPAVELHRRDHGAHALRIHLRGGRLVGHIGDDLHADPEPGDAGEHEAVQTQVEDLLDIAREDRRHERVVERDLGVARQRRGLGDGVVAGQSQHAPVPSHPGVVGVLEHVARPIHAGGLAVPHAEHPVVLGVREEPRHLAAEHRRRPQVLVEAGREDHVVLLEELRLPLERLIEASQGRAAIARDEGRGVEPPPAVGPVLVERQPDQRLDAGEIDPAPLLRVLGVQGEILGLGAHATPSAMAVRVGRRPHGMRERRLKQLPTGGATDSAHPHPGCVNARKCASTDSANSTL